MADLPGILDNGLCFGCGGCVAAIRAPGLEIAMSAEGYLRPRPVPLNAAQRETLDAVCAGRALAHDATSPDYHDLWGPIRRLATGYATDPQVRFRGSSGGVLSALTIHLLETGEIDFVLATGADPADAIGNVTTRRGSREEVIAAAGSRYAPSSPLADLETYLAAGRPFAFIGKPCDVATLRRMAKRDPRIDALIPYKLAFFCAGVPSRRGTQAVLDALGVEHDDVAQFQYRGDGWPGLARARRRDGSEESMTYEASWGRILNKHLQFRCKICPDGTGEFADVACADAWYGKDGYPDFEERDGRSLIVARTEAGVRLIAAAEARGAIAVDPLDVSEIARMQPYQVTRKRNALARSAAVWAARRQGPRYAHLALSRLSAKTSPKELLRNLWGTFRRSRGKRLA
ncbi:coenzyme F420 hydrogenase subunit beta [Sphingomonas sp. OV641]|uniref:Coenzyme F420 hydrogenase/dehydrogenase, beta subunit C-terminal domain n=1 Tax=Sphingomonas sp. OV641 TaxID=1881068 RepID=UPI0008CF98AD|nr:Coenzyme F420 hydrogenase/dehydrogenase, beta subunit C-terminal domain [Sphingomonas sp. OV641]SEJ21438.1 coenzyme F420 hydrogenase subunit beta [Sphingomonas sp. OV641]